MSNFLCNCNFIAEIGKHKTCSSIKQTHLLKYKSTMNHWIINQFNFYAVYQGLPWLLKGTQWQPFLLCQFLSRTKLGVILLSSVLGGEISLLAFGLFCDFSKGLYLVASFIGATPFGQNQKRQWPAVLAGEARQCGWGPDCCRPVHTICKLGTAKTDLGAMSLCEPKMR